MLSDSAASGVTNQVCGLQRQCIHQSQQIISQIPGPADDRARTGATHATVVVKNDMEVPRKIGNLRLPELAAAAESGDQKKGLTCSVFFDIQLGMADRNSTTPV